MFEVFSHCDSCPVGHLLLAKCWNLPLFGLSNKDMAHRLRSHVTKSADHFSSRAKLNSMFTIRNSWIRPLAAIGELILFKSSYKSVIIKGFSLYLSILLYHEYLFYLRFCYSDVIPLSINYTFSCIIQLTFSWRRPTSVRKLC